MAVVMGVFMNVFVFMYVLMTAFTMFFNLDRRSKSLRCQIRSDFA